MIQTEETVQDVAGKAAKKTGHRLVEHAGLLLTATLVAGVANYVYHILMARSLGPQDYGVLFSLLSLFMIFAFPLSTVQMVLTKYVALFHGLENYKQIRFLYTDFLKKLGVVALFLMVFFLIFSGFIRDYLHLSSKIPVVLLGLFTLFSFMMPVAQGMLQGLEHFFYLSLSSTVGALAKLALGVALVYWGYQVNGALLACVLSVFVTFVIAWVPLRGFLARHQAESTVPSKEIYEFFLPVFGALSFYGLLSYPDVVLVKHWFSPAAAGTYATAALLGKAFLFPAQSLAMAMFPKVSQMHARKEATFGLLKHTLILALGVLGAGVCVVFFFPEVFTRLLIREANVSPETFSLAVSLMRYYCLAYVPLAASYILIFYYLGCHQKRFVLVLGAGAVVFLILMHLFHSSLWQILTVMGTVSTGVFILLLRGVFRERV